MKNIDKKKILLICVEVAVLAVIAYFIFVIGIYLFESNHSHIINMPGIIKQDSVQAFNNQFLMYIDRQKGSNIKALAKTIIASNREQEDDKDGQLVSLKYEGLDGDIEDMHIIPSFDDVKQEELLDFAENIDRNKYYNVSVHQGLNKYVDEVIVSYIGEQ